MVFVATVFTFMMFGRLRRQLSVGSYSLALLGSHMLQTLVAYLALRHPEAGVDGQPQASVFQRGSDSFQKYYRPHGGSTAERSAGKAYRLRGAKRPDGALMILEGVADVRQVLAALCAMLAVGLTALGGWALVLAAGCVFARYYVVAKKQFGGVTGDLAGWFLQKCEIWMLAALAACQWLGVL